MWFKFIWYAYFTRQRGLIEKINAFKLKHYYYPTDRRDENHQIEYNLSATSF